MVHSVDSPEARLNFTKALFDWATTARLTASGLFCSHTDLYTGEYFPLTYALMQDSIKLCAAEFGFDPALFASHSLRIGGATQLASQNASQEHIQMMGRWRSAPVCLSYQHISSQS